MTEAQEWAVGDRVWFDEDFDDGGETDRFRGTIAQLGNPQAPAEAAYCWVKVDSRPQGWPWMVGKWKLHELSAVEQLGDLA